MEKDLLEKSKKQQSSDTNSSFVPPEVLAQESKKKKGLFNSGVDYQTSDLVRTFAFGMLFWFVCSLIVDTLDFPFFLI